MMMASFLLFPAKFRKSAVLTSLLVVTMLSVMVSSHQFPVGGDSGWIQPTPDMTLDTYNQWATRTRFRIGDTLYFKYDAGDSVLVVNSTDYQNCKTTNPIDKFNDGNTVFQFDRSGLFYFISGQPGHCKSGQKLVIRVLHPSDTISPGPAPAPSPDQSAGGGSAGGGGSWGLPPTYSSTTKLSAVPCFMSFLLSTLVILYCFM